MYHIWVEIQIDKKKKKHKRNTNLPKAEIVGYFTSIKYLVESSVIIHLNKKSLLQNSDNLSLRKTVII